MKSKSILEVPEILVGTLLGPGKKTTCMVSALKLVQRGVDAVSYSNYRIRDVSERLADGSYELVVNHLTLPVQVEAGQCLVAAAPTSVRQAVRICPGRIEGAPDLIPGMETGRSKDRY